LGGKSGKALGFQNDQGGYELRNSSFKGTVAPKGITTFRNASGEVSVFEGFFDFLSYQSIKQKLSLPKTDFLILNSTSFFEKSKPLMDNYERVRLFLDNDFTGEGCTKLGLSWGKKFEDESKLYVGHKDLNEWVQSIGKAQKRSYRPGLK
jgi:Toprim-like